MSKKVNVFLIGARKSATTTLASLMDLHNDISVCEGKEPEFFVNSHYSPAQLNAYHNKYSMNCDIWLDASTVYSVDKVADYIYEYNPDAKIIYILRDPMKRIISHYKMTSERRFYKGTLSESIYEWDPIIKASYYFDHAKSYIDLFGRSNVLILNQEQLRDAPEDLLSSIADFLEIKPFVQYIIYENVASKVKRLPYKLDFVLSSRPYKWIHKHILPQNFTNWCRSFLHDLLNKNVDMKLSDRDLTHLMDIVNPQLSKLQEYIDFDIDHWKIKRH